MRVQTVQDHMGLLGFIVSETDQGLNKKYERRIAMVSSSIKQMPKKNDLMGFHRCHCLNYWYNLFGITRQVGFRPGGIHATVVVVQFPESFDII